MFVLINDNKNNEFKLIKTESKNPYDSKIEALMNLSSAYYCCAIFWNNGELAYSMVKDRKYMNKMIEQFNKMKGE